MITRDLVDVAVMISKCKVRLAKDPYQRFEGINPRYALYNENCAETGADCC
jgi:hypothetical protein